MHFLFTLSILCDKISLEKIANFFQPNFLFVHYMCEGGMNDESTTANDRKAYFRVYR